MDGHRHLFLGGTNGYILEETPQAKNQNTDNPAGAHKAHVGLRPKILRDHGHMWADINNSGLSPLGTSGRPDQIKQMREQLQVELADSLRVYKEILRC